VVTAPLLLLSGGLRVGALGVKVAGGYLESRAAAAAERNAVARTLAGTGLKSGETVAAESAVAAGERAAARGVGEAASAIDDVVGRTTGTAAQKGRAGETYVAEQTGLTKNTKKFMTPSGTKRIPDFIDRNLKSCTNQRTSQTYLQRNKFCIRWNMQNPKVMRLESGHAEEPR
jgi:hypothetical protein